MGRVGQCCVVVFSAIGVVAALGGSCSVATSDSVGPASPSGTQPSGQQQTTVSAPPPEGTVYLAAVELQPEDPYPGGQLVVLVNGSSQPVDITCWTVRSAGTGKSARTHTDKALPPGGYLRLIPETTLFDSVDTLSLLDRRGRLVDQTPKLTDRSRDDQLWFRQRDGMWTFGRGFSLPQPVSEGRLVVGPDIC